MGDLDHVAALAVSGVRVMSFSHAHLKKRSTWPCEQS